MTLSALGIFSAAGAGGVVAGDFELLSTTILGSAQSSVVLDVSSFASTYKHLQIRFSGRTNTSQYAQEFTLRFNGVSTNSYSWHFLRAGGNGSSVSSTNGTTTNAMYVGQFSSALAATNNFGVGVVDILDAYSSTKFKTVRGFSGMPDAGLNRISFYSGLFQSKTATSSITVFSQNFSDNIIAGSRFSVYGIKG
jgi:hypothetical protein